MSAAAPHPPLSAPERLARIVDGLSHVVAARGVSGLFTAVLLFLVWGWLRRTAARARRLAARLEAGAPLVTARSRRPAAPRPKRPPSPRLPRGRAWLVRLAPGAAACGSQLQHLLTDPEMAALVAAPPMRRLLRPLCHMLGVRPPPIPKRAAAPRAAASAAHPPSAATPPVAEPPRRPSGPPEPRPAARAPPIAA